MGEGVLQRCLQPRGLITAERTLIVTCLKVFIYWLLTLPFQNVKAGLEIILL